MNVGPNLPSMWRIWPTKEDPKIYKFNGFWFELHQKKRIIERQTYSMLEWLGDVGGLFDGLILISRFFIVPIAAFTLKTELLSQIFEIRKKVNCTSGSQENHNLA